MGAEILSVAELVQTGDQEKVHSEERSRRQSGRWNPQKFTREQIRGLVQQVFFSNAEKAVRQVVFSPVEAEADVRSICRRVGEALALETRKTIALVGQYPHVLREVAATCTKNDGTPLRQGATRLRDNIWLVSAATNGDHTSNAFLHSYLGEIRREFEYSLVAAPPLGESNEALSMAQFVDGIILVLSAQRTRRITALRIKDLLERTQARLLGTVLSDRIFPIPEPIYRRL
jgi:hypothetical protein